MKKLGRILYSIFGAVSILMMFVGFYLMISNIGSNWTLFFIFLGVFVAGFLGLSIIAIGIMYRKKHPKTIEEK